MSEPITHVTRPRPPWRDVASDLTECGLSVNTHASIDREEFFSRLRKMGAQRLALFTCMTCFDTAQRHPTWESDPVAALSRETGFQRRDKSQVFRAELMAITTLIEDHREEFDAILARQEWARKSEERHLCRVCQRTRTASIHDGGSRFWQHDFTGRADTATSTEQEG